MGCEEIDNLVKDHSRPLEPGKMPHPFEHAQLCRWEERRGRLERLEWDVVEGSVEQQHGMRERAERARELVARPVLLHPRVDRIDRFGVDDPARAASSARETFLPGEQRVIHLEWACADLHCSLHAHRRQP